MQSLGQARVPTSARVAAELMRQAILEGRLYAGQRLKEETLSQELGISRTPVREALVMLQAEGLIVLESKRGASVRKYTPAELADMYQLRAVLESEAARRATSEARPADIAELEESCAHFRDLALADDPSIGDLVKENLRFHNQIIELAGSPWLKRTIQDLIQLPLVYKAYIWYSPHQKQMSVHYHSELVKSIGAGDAQRAEIIMKEHVYEAKDYLVATLLAEGDPPVPPEPQPPA